MLTKMYGVYWDLQYFTGRKLTELYVRRNQLSDFNELEHLTALPNLTVSPYHK